MTISEVVAGLRAGGHTIYIYKRPDGGIRITGIDGSVFATSSAQGNAVARSMAGQGELSSTQRKQRLEAGGKAKYGHKLVIEVKNEKTGEVVKVAKPRLTPYEKSRLRRLNRLAKATNAPKVGMAQARMRKGKHGTTDELWTAMKNNIRKNAGLGFERYSEWLTDRFDQFGYFPKTSAFLKEHLSSMTYEAMVHIHDIYYNWLTGRDMRATDIIDNEMLAIAKKGYKEGKDIKEKYSGLSSF